MRFGSLFFSNAAACVADDRKGEIMRVLWVQVRDFSLFDLVISFDFHAGINAAAHSLLPPIKHVDRSFWVVDASLVKYICYKSKLNSG